MLGVVALLLLLWLALVVVGFVVRASSGSW